MFNVILGGSTIHIMHAKNVTIYIFARMSLYNLVVMRLFKINN